MSTAYDWDMREHDGPQQYAEHPPEAKGSKRSRQTYSKYQTAVLETVFQTSKYIVRSKRQQMSAELNLTERQIKIWFQNRRMKEKKCGSGGGGLCKESPPVDDHCGTMATIGYVDDYAIPELGAAGYHTTAPVCDTVDFCHRTMVRHRPPPPPQHHDSTGGYTGYGSCSDAGGYDLLTHHEADPYAAVAKEHHWGAPVVTMDYDQDFFGDHGSDHFQRLPTALHNHHHHHHRPLMNSQVPDYCQPQLQATHGY